MQENSPPRLSVARSATGVVRVAAIPLLIWLSGSVRTTPTMACGHGFPSLLKEGSVRCRVSRQKLVPMPFAPVLVVLLPSFEVLETRLY